MLTTFFATLFLELELELELEFAIYLGVILSLVLFLAKTSTPGIPTLSFDGNAGDTKRKLVNINQKPVKQCPQIKIIRIDMSIYFGSINHIQNRIAHIVENEKIYHILIVSSGINFIDLAGAEALIAEKRKVLLFGCNSLVDEVAELLSSRDWDVTIVSQDEDCIKRLDAKKWHLKILNLIYRLLL